jgi:hypothetical protein
MINKIVPNERLRRKERRIRYLMSGTFRNKKQGKVTSDFQSERRSDFL